VVVLGECQICDSETSTIEPPGGWVLRTELWSARVAGDYEAPGWLFLQTRRHTEGPMGMDRHEAGELGVHLAGLSDAIRAVTGSEKVYVLAYGERFAHFHLVLLPRYPSAPPDLLGPGLFTRVGDLIDVDEAARVAAGIRDALGSGHLP
jgi:diadenosine tetraphosphate (Ap4A) HIT family hydrolase